MCKLRVCSRDSFGWRLGLENFLEIFGKFFCPESGRKRCGHLGYHAENKGGFRPRPTRLNGAFLTLGRPQYRLTRPTASRKVTEQSTFSSSRANVSSHHMVISFVLLRLRGIVAVKSKHAHHQICPVCGQQQRLPISLLDAIALLPYTMRSSLWYNPSYGLQRL